MSIKLVQGTTKPDITLTLKDDNTGDKGDPDSWDAVDLYGSVVTMKFRKANTSTILDTLTLTLIDGGINGQVLLQWGSTTLSVDPGDYEGEINITTGSDLQIVEDVLKFKVRSHF